MIWLLALLTAALMGVWIVEKQIHDRQQTDFLTVIHVNGIRGKTSTCRLLDAALRSRYRVFTKTTGTDPAWIGVDGQEHPIRRWGPANIREQLRMLRLAHRQGAQIVILECMAVQPQLQKVCQEQIVQSSVTVITNIRRDHMFELGETPEEIAEAFSSTVPRNGVVYTADPETARLMAPYCHAQNTEQVLCGKAGTSAENAQIALAVAERLGVPNEQALDGIARFYRPDFGGQQEYPLDETRRFLNLFSVNDPDSTALDLEQQRLGRPAAFLFNHRYDRPDRLLLFCRFFFVCYPNETIYCTGQGAHLLRRFLKGRAGPIVPLARWQDCLATLPEGTLLVGVGSIKGEGFRMVQTLEKGGNFR